MKFGLIGYVVMPEHVHLLLTEPPKGNPSKILQLKQKVSSALCKGRRKTSPKQLALQFAEAQTEERHFWQRRFYDFNVWSEKELWEKLHYMHRNPIERKLVGPAKEWPWSSWSHYEKRKEGFARVLAGRMRAAPRLERSFWNCITARKKANQKRWGASGRDESCGWNKVAMKKR